MKLDKTTYNTIKDDLNSLSKKIHRLISEDNEPYDMGEGDLEGSIVTGKQR